MPQLDWIDFVWWCHLVGKPVGFLRWEIEELRRGDHPIFSAVMDPAALRWLREGWNGRSFTARFDGR